MKTEIIKLLDIVEKLKKKYNRNFTLDGKIVGDIGEVLAASYFKIKLLPEKTKHYDAIEIRTNRKIQIKTTMKKYFTFPYDHTPEYFIACKVDTEGKLIPIFNGPGKIVKKYIESHSLSSYRNSYYSLTLSTLSKLNVSVEDKERIEQR
jgi:hypothetical protein